MNQETTEHLLRTLEGLRDSVTDGHLDGHGRYFEGTYNDLTQCHHGETGNFRNRCDGLAIAMLWNLWKDGHILVGDRAAAWRPMESAPRDGSVIEACARLPSATAGFPQHIQWSGGAWKTASYDMPREVRPWAWRPLTAWPREESKVPAVPSITGDTMRDAQPIEEISDSMLHDLLTTEQITPQRFLEETARRRAAAAQRDKPAPTCAADPDRMRNMRDLASLIERLKEADGPSRELDFWLSVRAFDPSSHTDEELQVDIELVGIEGMVIDAPFTSSIDAAVALFERVLPGWDWRIQNLGEDGSQGHVWEHGLHDNSAFFGEHASSAIALVLAILRALAATRSGSATASTGGDHACD